MTIFAGSSADVLSIAGIQGVSTGITDEALEAQVGKQLPCEPQRDWGVSLVPQHPTWPAGAAVVGLVTASLAWGRGCQREPWQLLSLVPEANKETETQRTGQRLAPDLPPGQMSQSRGCLCSLVSSPALWSSASKASRRGPAFPVPSCQSHSRLGSGV